MSVAPYAAFAAALLASPALAAPLSVVNVNAPAVNCVFNTSCTITVTDSSGNIPLPGIAGSASLQTRTFLGAKPAPGAGKRGYMYRVILTQAASILNPVCVTALRVAFGPVAQLNYNFFPSLDDVFVVTSGGLGSVGLSGADKVGNTITFTFAFPVCAGSSVGTGDSSFFFGLASTKSPKAINAQAQVFPGGAWVNVPARAPNF